MNKNSLPRFIIIDNASQAINLSNIIGKALKNADVRVFQKSATAIDYIISEYSGKIRTGYAILFIDVDHDPLNTLDFLNNFDLLDHRTRSNVSIIALSLSQDLYNKEQALSNRHVKNYLEKPMTQEVFERMFL
jgi:hypothetical protein